MSALWFRSGYALITEFFSTRTAYLTLATWTLFLVTLDSHSLRSTGHWMNNFVFHELCVSGSREKYRQLWSHSEMTSRTCWCRWINSVSVQNTRDRICWLRGFVITSPTRVLSAWDLHTWLSEQHHYTAFTVEDVSVSGLPTADIFGELNFGGFFAWFCPRRLVPRRGVASRPVHGRSINYFSQFQVGSPCDFRICSITRRYLVEPGSGTRHVGFFDEATDPLPHAGDVTATWFVIAGFNVGHCCCRDDVERPTTWHGRGCPTRMADNLAYERFGKSFRSRPR